MSKKRSEPISSKVSEPSSSSAAPQLKTPKARSSRRPRPSSTTSPIEPIVSSVSKKKRKCDEELEIKLVDNSSPVPPWPEHFKELQRVYQALNTVFTFCSARKHLHTTIDNMRSSIESLLKAPLALESIAQIKTLLPIVVRFVYVEREALGALEKLSNKKIAAKKDFEIYEPLPNAEASGDASQHKAKAQDEVLLFQFIDGELKSAQKSHLLPTNPRSSRQIKPPSPSLKDLLMPTYSPKEMSKMIEKRNLKFKEAIDELILACAAQEPPIDPVIILIDSSQEHMPCRSGLPPNQKMTLDSKQRLQHYIDHPEERPTIQSLLSEMMQDVHYRDQIVPGGQRTTPPRMASFGKLDQPLSPTLAAALFSTKQIKNLYSHQADAINHLATGGHVIVSTSTSSGKSLVYQLPMLQALEHDQCSCGLYIFPTKALAQDQKRALSDLIYECGPEFTDVKIVNFDGDTPREERQSIRETANIIYTNPDMLHLTILPHEQLWRRFFQNLKFVVVDELHVYSGLFGSHMSFLMRRLRRICEAVGNHCVQFISCSATIQNPVEHMKTIFGLSDVHLVSQDGSPTGAKQHVIWNPPFVDEKDPSQGRLSSLSESARLFRFLISNGVRTIVFCRIRKSCELMIRQVREELIREDRQDLVSRVRSYRSGYTAQERRSIEQEMYSGELLGIIATTALELGIDIGNLDAVLTLGFPHSLSGLRQQAGRAGRRNKESLSMLILDQKASNQYFAQHPDQLFDAAESEIWLDLENENVVGGHLQCAADEIPIHSIDDQVYFGADLPAFCQANLIKDEHGYFHPHPRFHPHPAQHLSIRKNEEVSYSIVDVSIGREPKILEEIEASRVMYECYEGAIFIHQGQTFQVVGLDHPSTICKLREVTVDYLTRPRELNELDPIRTMRIKAIPNSSSFACYGTVKITSTVYGYLKLDRRQNVLDSFELPTEPLLRHSKGFWLDLPPSAIITLRKYEIHLPTAVHAAEHALLNLAGDDLKLDCRGYEDPWTTSPTDRPKRTRLARLILFDHPTKSGGVSIRAFDQLTRLLNLATDLLNQCECEEGCKSCLLARFTCSNGALMVQGAKFGAKVVLNSLLGREWQVNEDEDEEVKVPNSDAHLALPEPVLVADSVTVIGSDGIVLESTQATSLLSQYHRQIQE